MTRTDSHIAVCVLCGTPFDDDEDGGGEPRLSLKDAGYLAEHGPDGAILTEACKSCAADAFDGVVSPLFPPR